MKRRVLLQSLGAALAASSFGAFAQQDYPNRPIRLIVPWPAGGVTDITARILGERLGEALGKAIVVDNRPGANGFIGTQAVATAEPDGYTLLLVTATTHAVAPSLYRKMPYDPIKSFTPISQITVAPTIAVTSANSPYRTLADLVAAAKKDPGKLNYATYGAGSSSTLAAVLFMQAGGVELTAIPYKGATPAITGLMGGETDVFFDSIPSALPHVQAGRLRALAVTGENRVSAAPDIPTLSEMYPGVVFNVWQGVQAPAGTPEPIVRRLHAEVQKIVAMKEVQERLIKLGAFPVSSNSPADFTTHIQREQAKVAELVKRAKIPPQD